MKIAYLLNTYPMTSLTFVRREIEALEARGVTVRRFAVRRWADRLVDPLDIAEAARTRYLLDGNVAGLLAAALRQAILSPRAFLKGLGLSARLVANARGRFVAHAAYLLQASAFLQAARAEGIDHVHVHFSTNGTALALLAAQMGGPSFSFTAHGPDEFLHTDRSSLPLKLSRAAFVIAISGYCRATLLRLGRGEGAGRILLARCGLDLAEFSRPAPPAGASQEIVCVGRLCPQKGQTHLPAIAARLRAAAPHLRITLIGDGETRAEIEALIRRYDVGDMVRIAGWQANGAVRAALAHARALILPSHAEGLPIVILEALALRRPVITTAVAGIPEIVDAGCGWIVPAGSQDELAAAVAALMDADAEQLARLGAEGRARVERLHDLRDLAATLEEQFERAIALRRAAAKAAPARPRPVAP